MEAPRHCLPGRTKTVCGEESPFLGTRSCSPNSSAVRTISPRAFTSSDLCPTTPECRGKGENPENNEERKREEQEKKTFQLRPWAPPRCPRFYELVLRVCTDTEEKNNGCPRNGARYIYKFALHFEGRETLGYSYSCFAIPHIQGGILWGTEGDIRQKY